VEAEMDKLTDRLRGIYSVGPKAVYGTRSFADFIPPISLEAANRIDELEAMLEKKLDLIRCGIGANYSGDPLDNALYREVVLLIGQNT
jgi:hypothetical protein